MVLARSEQVSGIDFWSLSDCFYQFNVRIEEPRLRAIFDQALQASMGVATSATRREKAHLSTGKRPDLLCRKEFIEVLLRSAPFKYPDLPPVEAAQEFLLKNLLLWLPPVSSLQDFRVNELWTESVHQVFLLNKDEIAKTLARYSAPLKYADLVRLLMDDSSPPIVDNEKDLIHAAVISKTMVAHDLGHESARMS